MMMLRATSLALLLLATAGHAQDVQKMQAARAYVKSDVQQELLDSMLSVDGMMAQMNLHSAKLTQGQRQLLASIVSEELSSVRETMEISMIKGMAEVFTLEEINALHAFYSSPVGASAMRKINPFMATTMERLAPTFQQMTARLQSRIQQELGK